MKRVLLSCGVALGIGMSGGAVSTTMAQECHYAYDGCLPVVYDLDCAEIGYAVVQVWDVYDDPYQLDVVGGAGNGWTCDGVG